MKNGALVLFAVAGMATVASASTVSATFTSFGTASFLNKNSKDAQGTITNDIDSFVAASGGTVNAIRVSGNLTSIASGTFASEARVRMSAGAGNAFTAFNLQAGTGGTFVTQVVGPSAQFAVTPFTLAAGTVNFEWFESAQDGTAGLPESRWDNVSYEFGNGSTTVVNGNFGLGTLAGNGVTLNSSGSHVSGGLDFFTFTIPAGVTNVGDYLNIQTSAGTIGDTELAVYDSAGNFVSENDDGIGTSFYSQMSFGASDVPAAGPVLPGDNGLTLAPGTYTLVVAGYNSVFGATIGAITPGTAVGTYGLAVTYVPAPGAMALLGLGGLVATRRRR